MICSTILTTRCKYFQSEALQLVRRLSVVDKEWCVAGVAEVSDDLLCLVNIQEQVVALHQSTRYLTSSLSACSLSF